VRALTDLKTTLEASTVSHPEFVYTTYIRTTPDALWRALTDPAFTERYWGVALRSDWQVGSEVVWEQHGVTIADPGQVVLEADPPRRLSYTFHTFTPEFGASVGFSDELLASIAAEPRSKVSFEIEPLGPKVRLTVVHDGFPQGSEVLGLVSGGWPAVVANLKTLLETGEPLPAEDLAHR
jgi:uncharacterized protein YndB with AHSA1/START domain